MTAYYNENDPKIAAWLRLLIANNVIASGEVDERSIEDVRPSDLRGFRQCHFFAGIGGWSEALRLAGWRDDQEVWTGSCPCQPFSAAGKRTGAADERHLWPSWFHLLEECRPAVVFGEQVDAAVKHGWLDLVHSDMEGIGYAYAPAVVPAAGVGAPHGRHRILFVAHTDRERQPRGKESNVISIERAQQASRRSDLVRRGPVPGVGHAEGVGRVGRSDDADGWRRECSFGPTGALGDFWSNADWVRCSDRGGCWRPIESGTFPLADGVQNRVVMLRGYGNAIPPQVAAAFIESYVEATT